MKAQGLPINFIVIAALAILILILAAGFVIAGGSSVGGAMAPQQVRSTCQGYCQNLQQDAATQPYSATFGGTSPFCDRALATQTGTTFCNQSGVNCIVTFNDGSTLLVNNNC